MNLDHPHRTVAGMLVAGTLLGSSLLGAAPPPNVVVILADDLGAAELGIYGHPTHRTPHLDRLATRGVFFSTAFAPPVCHPSRHALMTGQYPHRNGVFHFANRAGGPPVPYQGDDNIAARPTFGQLFQAAGYATAMAGKWQLSGKLPDLVRETGFDEYLMWAYDHNLPAGTVHTGGREPDSKRTSRYWHPSLLHNGAYRPTGPDDYGPDLFTEFLIDFADRQRAQARPFFLYYSMVLPHAPYYPTPDSTDSPADRFVRHADNWRANVEYMDQLVGRLTAALQRMGALDNTLIIFTADNGTAQRGKGDTTEAGARVPLIAHGPGLVKPQGASSALADITDVLPTICEFAGIPLPPGQVHDGVSLARHLRGESQPLREWIYAPLGGRRVLRTSRWLLEDNTPWSFGRLYDCGDSRDGTGYRELTATKDPTVQAARAQLQGIMRHLPVPDVTPDDPRMIPREKPHYVPRAERRGLNSPVMIDVADGRAKLTVYPPADGEPRRCTILAADHAAAVGPWHHATGEILGVLSANDGVEPTPAMMAAALALVRERAVEFGLSESAPVVEAGNPAALSSP